jgi:outer membrane protein assembly factor BamB
MVLPSALSALLLASGPSRAENWPCWRGPTGGGQSAEKGLPLTWGGAKNENILWKTAIVGRGYSSPIVWDDSVFVTSAEELEKDGKYRSDPQQYVVCLRAATGKELWRTLVPPGPANRDGKGGLNSANAIATPCTEGERVYAWFGTAVLVALDFDGKLIWRKEFPGPYTRAPDISSSPLLFGDSLIVLCDNHEAATSFLVALEPKTGKVKWEKKRPAGHNVSSPIIIKVKDRFQLVFGDSQRLNALDPSTGASLWTCDAIASAASPIYASGLVYADRAPRGTGMVVDPTGQGDVTATHVKWRAAAMKSCFSSPIVVGKHVYKVNEPDVLTCCEWATGKLVYSERLPGVSPQASPVATADGRIYFASVNKSFVIKAGSELEILAVNTLVGSY